jgi:hypothetical protein
VPANIVLARERKRKRLLAARALASVVGSSSSLSCARFALGAPLTPTHAVKAKIAATSPKPVAATIFSTQSNKQLTTSEALSESLSNRMRLHYGASPTIVTSADSTVSPTHTMFPPISPGTDLPTTATMASRVNVQAAKTPSAADFERMNAQWQTALQS